MKFSLAALLIVLLSSIGKAQSTPGRLSFALPNHPGSLSLDQGGFKIKELSAKSNNGEFGIRAEDGDLHFLGFMFLWPEKPHLTAETCRDEMLKSEHRDTVAASDRLQMKSATGVNIALAFLIPNSANKSALRAFVASGTLCGDLLFSLDKPVTGQIVPMEKAKEILTSLRFDADANPTFRDAFAYATVEWDRHQTKGAALAYQAALKLVDTSDDPLKWRRITTDQLSMALGVSGDIQQSRTVNQAAIAKDPSYPLYYYNLACADAEEGNASGARTHLQEAFERRADVLSGETLTDPATDDSFVKLKSDKAFWAFVEDLSKQLKKS